MYMYNSFFGMWGQDPSPFPYIAEVMSFSIHVHVHQALNFTEAICPGANFKELLSRRNCSPEIFVKQIFLVTGQKLYMQ